VGPVGSTIPGVIQANGQGTTWVPQSQLPMHVENWAIRANVYLAHTAQPLRSNRLIWTGRRFRFA
jgi:hypothetical protein